MPNAIDRCSSCRQPVYVEEGVVGGCACQDRSFRILLAQQKQRNNAGHMDFASSFVANEAPDLSNVNPALLMSAAGRHEFEAAQQLAGIRGRTQQAVMFDDTSHFTAGTVTEDSRTMLENNSYGPPAEDVFAQAPVGDLDLSDEDGDWTGLSSNEPQRHNARVASVTNRMDGVDLAAMWMQGTGIPYDPSQ